MEENQVKPEKTGPLQLAMKPNRVKVHRAALATGLRFSTCYDLMTNGFHFEDLDKEKVWVKSSAT